MVKTSFTFDEYCDDLGPAKVVHLYDPSCDLRSIVVVDNVACGPSIGGVRMAKDVSTQEVFRLARAMTLKNAAAGLAHGGGKAGILADPKTCDKQRLIRAFAKAIRDLSEYIPGPDMGTDESCMAWVQDEIQRAVGLPRVLGGIPLDEIGATGYGLAVCAEVAAEFCDLELSGATVAIEGFGNVGQHAARYLVQKGAKLVAASDTGGTLLDPAGIDVDELAKVKAEAGSVTAYDRGKKLTNTEIFTQQCDILVPAARPDCIHAENAKVIKAKLILQGANIPATPEAERILHERGILNMPDFICNAGGVICAAVEYSGGTEGDALEAIQEKISRNTREVIRRCRDEKLPPRRAAVELARQRVKAAMDLRSDTAMQSRTQPVSRPQSLDEYHRLRKSFSLECPEYFNFGTDVLDRWARMKPEHPALRWVSAAGEDRTITYAEMATRSNQVANALLDLGLRHGDQVLVDLPNLVQWWETMIALTKAGIIAIPGTTLLTEKDIAYRVKAAEIDAVVTDAAGAEKVDHIAGQLPDLQFKIQVGGESRSGWRDYGQLVGKASTLPQSQRTRSDQPALIYFTSGTTGPPKMVMHTHASYGIGHQLTARFWLGLETEDLHWNLSDTGWAKTAYSGLFAPWIAGSTIFVRHHPGKFDPRDVLNCLSEYPITSFCAPPTVYRLLVQQDLTQFRSQSLRQCMAAGEPLNVNVLSEWREASGLTIREGYGQTETVILCASIPDLDVKPGSMGLPPPGLDVAIVDKEGRRLPPGEPGEIAVRVEPERPIGLFHSYCQNPDATAGCYQGEWYLTGDCAYRDEDGYMWFVARTDDIITSAAYRIGPFEVENALMEHPAVAEVAVVGKPDPERTEIVKAFVVLAAGYEPTDKLVHELQQHTKQATAPYKYPREIEFMDELPKTHTGKIRRTELRTRAANRQTLAT